MHYCSQVLQYLADGNNWRVVRCLIMVEDLGAIPGPIVQ